MYSVYVIFTFCPSLYRWSARRRGSKERQEAQDVWCWSFGTFKLVRNPFSSHFLLKYTHYCTYMYMYSYFYNLSFPFVAFLFFSCSNISFSSLFSFFVLSLSVPPSLPLYLPLLPLSYLQDRLWVLVILQSATQKWRRLAKGKINNNNNKHMIILWLNAQWCMKEELINTTCNAFNNLTAWDVNLDTHTSCVCIWILTLLLPLLLDN